MLTPSELPIPEQIAELSHREATIMQWLAKPNLSEMVTRALEEELRRNRNQQRALTLRQFQGPMPFWEHES